jgi:hypothetical protein
LMAAVAFATKTTSKSSGLTWKKRRICSRVSSIRRNESWDDAEAE